MAQPGRQEPPPGSLGQCLLALGPEQDLAPVPFGDAGDPDEGQRDLGHHREDDRADEAGAMIGVRFGMISNRMIRQLHSPEARDAST